MMQHYNMTCDSVNIALLLIFNYYYHYLKNDFIRDAKIDRPEEDGFHRPKHSHIDILCQSNEHACGAQCSRPVAEGQP